MNHPKLDLSVQMKNDLFNGCNEHCLIIQAIKMKL